MLQNLNAGGWSRSARRFFLAPLVGLLLSSCSETPASCGVACAPPDATLEDVP
ncbi:hypothetical protein HUW62_04225 [Myxococcus sp. AM011]|uniref:hypothetical protein n=1 Tax=Myxococcus sp. AM011 TaxID=2745200 RepID=UPI001595217C|nr:hypothetical protein [Myxococcus sp. AM011]NVJ20427.1 hypothetical protein [Myxococcus sp. AM011]